MTATILQRVTRLATLLTELSGPLTRQDRRRWAAARTLAELGELTAQWLEGSVASQPGYYGPVDVDEQDAPGMTAVLVRLNRAGLVSNCSQAGHDGLDDAGAHWRQLAAVTGFAEQTTVDQLTTALTGTRYQTIVWPCASGMRNRGRGIVVTSADGRPVTRFGDQIGRYVIANEIYDGCHQDAIAAVCAALQVTLYDPQPGANDLWPTLAERWPA
jgi:hypothetical protein